MLDEGSGVANVSLAIGRTPRDTSLLGWTNLQLGGSGLVTVVIPDGVPSWVKLRAINNGKEVDTVLISIHHLYAPICVVAPVEFIVAK